MAMAVNPGAIRLLLPNTCVIVCYMSEDWRGVLGNAEVVVMATSCVGPISTSQRKANGIFRSYKQ